jgi:hypothetical protein
MRSVNAMLNKMKEILEQETGVTQAHGRRKLSPGTTSNGDDDLSSEAAAEIERVVLCLNPLEVRRSFGSAIEPARLHAEG